MTILTFKYRVKDKTAQKRLIRHARAVNFVWNYCCEIQRKAESKWKSGVKCKWPSHFDLVKLTTGCAKELNLHSDTVNKVCAQFVISRDAKRKCPKFRANYGSKAALGFIPYIPRAIRIEDDRIKYLGKYYRFWKSRPVQGEFKAGCFVQDSRGRWYVTFQCEVPDDMPTGNGKIGIDLGLKTLATCSDGKKIPALQHYRKYEDKLAVAQRAGNKKRVKAIHAKIANARRHHLHEQSTALVKNNNLIVVGNVNAAQLAKTKMAKSVLDAGWSMFRNMLAYKARRHRACFVIADERFTSQTCSCCGSIPVSSPKGMGALGVRHWECCDCGSIHDRDVNAALNILRVGAEHCPPAVEILAL